MCNADAAYHKAMVLEFLSKAEYIHVVSNAKVTANLVFFDINCTDYDYDFSNIRKLHEHLEFAVWLKSRKNAGCMVVVKKLAAEFKVKLVSKFRNSFLNVF